MKNRSQFRLLIVFAAFAAFLAFGAPAFAAPPDPPIPVSPLGGPVVTPTFSWQASAGAAKYEVEVGPQNDLNLVYWSAQTVHLTLTPNDADKFPNEPLYWRVRAKDSSNAVGLWTNKIFVTKTIPAPTLVSPADGSTSVVIPTFEWERVPEATYYQVELSSSDTFIVMETTYTTYNTRLTPVDTFAHGEHFWRVRSVDADGHLGPPSTHRSFRKDIPAPALVSPADGSISVVIPTFEWQRVPQATYYQVELSASDTFVVMEATYTTYNTRLTPVDTFAHGKHFWRVRSVDADGHMGTASTVRSFTKDIPSPVLVSPVDGHTGVVTPTFQWLAVPEATYYKVEVSTSPTFVPVEAAYTTYNTVTTPVDTLAHGMHYWRVSGVDAGGHVGSPSAGRSFTKVINAPVLVSPSENATVTVPTLEWAAVDGAAYYKVELSTSPTFVPVDATYTTYSLRITPVDALPLNTYYWRVSGVDADGHVGNNNWRGFTLIAPPAATDPTPQLLTPLDGETIAADPNFSWSRMIGADHYRLVVSIYADFHTPYSSVTTDYNSYTPAVATSPDAYPNGTYYWRVEARNSSGTVIATSAARSFTKNEPLPLVAPAHGATGLTADPTFQWSQILGAHHYRLVVSTDPDFSPTYSSVLTDYNSYTPAVATSPDAYPNGTYYWKVEARTSDGTVIATSAARSLTKQEPLPLIAPTNGAALPSTPTFEWSPVVGAHHYRLVVSTDPDFTPSYESVITDYARYTPYSPAGKASYANGAYYWKVEARTSDGTVITTSEARSFTIGVRKLYLPLVLR